MDKVHCNKWWMMLINHKIMITSTNRPFLCLVYFCINFLILNTYIVWED